MRKELNPSLKSLALQLQNPAVRLDPRDAKLRPFRPASRNDLLYVALEKVRALRGMRFTSSDFIMDQPRAVEASIAD